MSMGVTPDRASAEDLDGVDATEPTLGGDVMMSSSWLRWLFAALYALVFVVGLSGNSLVVYVVSRNAAMRTITNIFIANLAVSDILMCLLAVPFTPAAIMLPSWPFGEAICHVLPMAQCVSVYVSTLTSIAIAVDRYCVIVHPFRPRMKTSVCLLIIAAIWLTSLSISMPLAIYQTVGQSRQTSYPKIQNSFVTLAAYGGKRTVTICPSVCLSFCLSVSSAYSP